jgi:hypothetical protein
MIHYYRTAHAPSSRVHSVIHIKFTGAFALSADIKSRPHLHSQHTIIECWVSALYPEIFFINQHVSAQPQVVILLKTVAMNFS